jgi:hypothetical protein
VAEPAQAPGNVSRAASAGPRPRIDAPHVSRHRRHRFRRGRDSADAFTFTLRATNKRAAPHGVYKIGLFGRTGCHK